MTETILDTRRSRMSRFWDPKEMNSRRSLTLFAIGAVVGLSIAAYGLFTAVGTTTRILPPEDVAMINGRHILRADFITQVQIETALPFDQTTKAQRTKVLNEMADEELLVQRGLEVDLAASDPDVRIALANGVNLQVDADVASQLPSDEQLRTFYQAHKAAYSSEGVMQIRDLLISQTSSQLPQDGYAMAKRAIEDLRMGVPVDTVKTKYGMSDTTKLDKADNFDFAAKIKLGAKVFDEAAKLTTGQVSEPFLDEGNLHIIVMVKRTAPIPRNYEDARDTVLQDYKKAATDQIEQANLKYLRQKADTLIAAELRQ